MPIEGRFPIQKPLIPPHLEFVRPPMGKLLSPQCRKAIQESGRLCGHKEINEITDHALHIGYEIIKRKFGKRGPLQLRYPSIILPTDTQINPQQIFIDNPQIPPDELQDIIQSNLWTQTQVSNKLEEIIRALTLHSISINTLKGKNGGNAFNTPIELWDPNNLSPATNLVLSYHLSRIYEPSGNGNLYKMENALQYSTQEQELLSQIRTNPDQYTHTYEVYPMSGFPPIQSPTGQLFRLCYCIKRVLCNNGKKIFYENYTTAFVPIPEI